MKPNSCMSFLEPRDGYSVLTRQYVPSGEYHLEPQWVKNTMTRLCRSDMDIKRQGVCNGCARPQDMEYFKEKGLL